MTRAGSPRCAGVIALAWLALSACGEPAPRTALLITIDTHRADHAFTERAGVRLTPGLDALAASALRFEAASAVGNCTSVGVAGILTGLHPHRSAVTINPHMLPPGVPTLATALRDRGFRTAGFVANPVLRPGMGFERGFEHYDWVKAAPPDVKARAASVNERALAWLEGVPPGDDVFLWLHYMEPHGPYRPPRELLAEFPLEAFGAPRPLPLLPEGDQSGRGGIPFYQHDVLGGRSDARDYLARYAAEVRAVDRRLERLLARVAEQRDPEHTTLIVTADHGEALEGDHGVYFAHQAGLTEDQVRVPLLVSCPGCGEGVVRRPVSGADVLPTVLAALGVAPPPDVDGRSLLDPEPRPVVSQANAAAALRRGDWKLIRPAHGPSRLFHLGDDPGELEDRASAEPAIRAELEAELEAILARPPLAAPVRRPRLSAQRSPEAP